MPTLQTNIPALGGVYKRFQRSLEKLGILRLEDFLYHIPFRYEDFSLVSNISAVQEGETVTVRGRVAEIKNEHTRRRLTIQKAKIQDDSGTIGVIWFNQPYIPKTISVGDLVSLSGKVEQKGERLQLNSPEFELGKDNIHTGRLIPVYPETAGISSKWLRRQVHKLLTENRNEITEFLPEEILARNKLQPLFTSIQTIHFPDRLEEVKNARKRLAFNELFLIQVSSMLRKMEWQKKLKGFSFEISKNQKKIKDFIKSLPFELTTAQKTALDEIFKDLSGNKPMNRLLEGDVGSGKTVVAGASMYLAYLNGFQSAFMAPTEILAQQHYNTISNLLSNLGVRVHLVTSEIKTLKIKDLRLKNKGNHQSSIINHQSFDVLVGTHAILSEKINFGNLGFVVVDEQQRFGVEQRTIIRKKGQNPHFLTMTATPIPRTIALTMYGDLDLSVLDEMPKGRKIVKTWLVPNFKRNSAYEWIKKQLSEKKCQVFIVCPFIEESETMASVKAATMEFERLKNDVFKTYKITMLHGKLKSKEKDKALADFKNQKFDILVTTPVVEVGIDIPNADIILIETAERFGLSQLHQLRGRVGRSDRQAYCLLFTESLNPVTKQRLSAMEKTNVGAELAELDLRLRGPGEIYGTKQSGRNLLKIASFSDFDLIKQTKEEAKLAVSNLNKFPVLKQKITGINAPEVSPD